MAIINWKLALIVSRRSRSCYSSQSSSARILVEYRVSRRTNSKITGAFNENFQGVRVVKGLLREDENTSSRSDDQDVQSLLQGCVARRLFLPTVQIVAAVAWAHHWLWRFADHAGRDDHRRHPGVCFIPHIHDVADPGLCPGLCRDAALHRVSERIFKLIDTPSEVHDRPDAIEAKHCWARSNSIT